MPAGNKPNYKCLTTLYNSTRLVPVHSQKSEGRYTSPQPGRLAGPTFGLNGGCLARAIDEFGRWRGRGATSSLFSLPPPRPNSDVSVRPAGLITLPLAFAPTEPTRVAAERARAAGWRSRTFPRRPTNTNPAPATTHLTPPNGDRGRCPPRDATVTRRPESTPPSSLY